MSTSADAQKRAAAQASPNRTRGETARTGEDGERDGGNKRQKPGVGRPGRRGPRAGRRGDEGLGAGGTVGPGPCGGSLRSGTRSPPGARAYSTMIWQNHLRVVLVQPRNSLNIGAAARAMLNFGFSRLWLVKPYDVAFRAARSAVGAAEVLEKAWVTDDLGEALGEASLVVGTSGVEGRSQHHVQRSLPEGSHAVRTHLESAEAALVFGSEKHGLGNERPQLLRLGRLDSHPRKLPFDEPWASRRRLLLRAGAARQADSWRCRLRPAQRPSSATASWRRCCRFSSKAAFCSPMRGGRRRRSSGGWSAVCAWRRLMRRLVQAMIRQVRLEAGPPLVSWFRRCRRGGATGRDSAHACRSPPGGSGSAARWRSCRLEDTWRRIARRQTGRFTPRVAGQASVLLA